jgi:hypothetical protein
MCKCVNDALLNVDDEVKELVSYALLDSTDGSQRIQFYLQSTTTDRAVEVMQQLQYFGSLDSKMNTCISESTDVHQQFKFELDDLTNPERGIVLVDFYDNQKTIEKLLSNLLLLEGCEFAHQFIRFGIELEKK